MAKATTNGKATATANATPKAEKVKKEKKVLTEEQKAARKAEILANRAKVKEVKAKIADNQGALKGLVEIAEANRASNPAFAEQIDAQIQKYTQKVIDLKSQLAAGRKSPTERLVKFFTDRVIKEMAKPVKVNGVDTDNAQKVLADVKALLRDFFAEQKAVAEGNEATDNA